MFRHKGVIFFIQLLAIYLQRVSSTSIDCFNLTFGYGEQQTSVSPFRIDVQNSTNGQLDVTLTSNDNSTFQGFILQAREVGTNVALGTFVKLPNGTKAFRCNNDNDTATHSNNNTEKFTLTFTWSPPDNVTGIIVFNATVAANDSAYWLGISSKQISLPWMSSPRLTASKATQSLSPSSPIQQPSLTQSPSESPSLSSPIQLPSLTQSPSAADSPSLSPSSPSQQPSLTQSPSIAPTQSFSTQQPSSTPSPSQSPSVGEPPLSTQSPSQSFSMQQPSLTPSPSVGEPPVSTQSPSITTRRLGVNDTQSTIQPPMSNISATQTSVAPPVSTEIPTTTPQPTTVEVQMTIDQEFDDELTKKTSKRFQDLATAVKTAVENVYKRANRSVEVSVKSFKSGSIIAQLSLKFPTRVNGSQALNPLRNAINSKNFTIGKSTVLSVVVDECNSNPCDKNATCDNKVGSFTCTCNEGFTGDGKKCTVVTKDGQDDDDDDIKKILIASVVLVAIILLIVFFFFVVLIRRLLKNK